MTTTAIDRFTAGPTVREQAQEVTSVWLTEAFANRRHDLMTLLSDVADDPSDVYWEHLTVAESLGADPDDLELGAELQEEIVEAANDTISDLAGCLLRILLDEMGEKIWDIALPEAIRDTIDGIAGKLGIYSTDVERLMLRTVIEEYDRYLARFDADPCTCNLHTDMRTRGISG